MSGTEVTDWESARKIFGKKTLPPESTQKDPESMCNCSHSKYHHTNVTGPCMQKEICGCEEYQLWGTYKKLPENPPAEQLCDGNPCKPGCGLHKVVAEFDQKGEVVGEPVTLEAGKQYEASFRNDGTSRIVERVGTAEEQQAFLEREGIESVPF